jgi:hypothetical protein
LIDAPTFPPRHAASLVQRSTHVSNIRIGDVKPTPSRLGTWSRKLSPPMALTVTIAFCFPEICSRFNILEIANFDGKTGKLLNGLCARFDGRSGLGAASRRPKQSRVPKTAHR